MSKIRVLIAEDDKKMQMVYDMGLPSAIFEKRFANNGKEALEVYSSWNPEIIVLDIMMPVMSGYETLKTIRGEHKDMSTVIIMATSKAEKEDIVACMKHGIEGYIIKPFKWTEIADKILQCYRKVNPEKVRIVEELHSIPEDGK